MNKHTKLSQRSKVTSKGQTTIPQEVREALALEPGTQIEWVINASDGTATLKPRINLRAIDLVGMLGPPPNGRHVTIEEMDEAIGQAVAERFRQKTAR